MRSMRTDFGAVLWCFPAFAFAACAGGEIDGAPLAPGSDVPSITQIGDFAVRVESLARIQVEAQGRRVLDGLPGGAVSAGAPPLVGFAVQDAEWTYETSFGQFRITDVPHGDWIGASHLSVDDQTGSRFTLASASGAPIARIAMSAPEPRHLVLDVTAAGSAKRFSLGMRCEPDDRFVGFGSQSWDVDQRGQTVPVFVSEQGVGKDTTDDYKGIWQLVGRRHSAQWAQPWTLTRRGTVMIGETQRYMRFALCSERDDAARIELEMPAKIHLFAGDSPAHATTLATGVFGRPRVPPRFAFAPWNDAVKGPDKVLGLAKRLRDADVPSSVIWTEDWRGGEQDGEAYKLKEEWDVDTGLYPDMAGMTSALHAQGFKFFVYFNPFIYQESKAWPETQPKGWLVKKPDGSPYVFPGAKLTDTGLLDLSNPDARAWAVAKMRASMKLGADGWMNDYAEWLPTDAVLAKGSGLDLHNQYTVLWQQVAREAIDGMDDGVARLFFARSGWFGTPPLVDVFWAGDQRTSFQEDDGLPTVPIMGINLSVHGSPAYGHDVAGYQSSTNPPSTKELFFRWTELGAFSPVMRTHHGYQADKQWTWEKDDETKAMWRRYTIEHVTLAPLFEALAKEASQTGIPILRGLFFHYPGEDAAWTTRDEFLLGSSILVAPVVTAQTTKRSVWLPPGGWFPWTGGARVEGGTQEVPAPLGEIPVFARAGSILARYPDRIRTLDLSSPAVPGPAEIGDDRDVLAFLGGDATFTEVGGLSYALSGKTSASGAATYAWDGTSLGACAATPVAPCVGPDEGTGAVARVSGNGTLTVTAGGTSATIAVTGGAPGRALTIRVRR